MASSGCGMVPRRASSSMLIVRRSTAAADWFESHAASCARALSIDTPGFRRPMISTPTLSSPPRELRHEVGEAGQRRPEVRGADLEAPEPRRHHADNLVRRAGDEHGPSEHVRIAIEVALPSLVAQHDHGIAAGAIVIGGAERPPHRRVHAHDIEEAGRHEVDRHHPAVDPQIDLGQRRVGVRKDARFRDAALRNADG